VMALETVEVPTYAQQRFWKWRLPDSDHLLFQASPTTPTRVGLPTQQRRHLIKFSPTVPTSLEFKGSPVTPLDPATGYIRLPVPPLPCDPPPPNSCKLYPTLQSQFRHELLPWQCELFGSIRKAGPTYKLHHLLQNTKSIMIVSDASVQKNGQSGFAWIIANEQVILWRGNGLAPGPSEDTYSGRAEAYGIFAALIFLRFYLTCYDHQIPAQPCTCYCDNSGVITNLTSMLTCTIRRPNDTTNDDYDLYVAILAEAKNCRPLRLHYIHVKGHQDQNKDTPLTIEAAHNVDCDNVAKNYVRTCLLQSTTLSNPAIEAAQPHLLIGGKLIC